MKSFLLDNIIKVDANFYIICYTNFFNCLKLYIPEYNYLNIIKIA